MNTNSLNRSLLGSLFLLAVPSLLLADTKLETGWSIEATAFDAKSSGTVSAFTLDDDEAGTSLGVGYAFNKHFAVTAAYGDFGEHYATDCPPPTICLVQNVDQVDVRTLSAAVIGSWSVTDVIELYSKFGITAWDTDFARFDRDDIDRDFVYGVGLGAWVSPNWRISLQYEKVDDFELELIGLGLAYRF